MQRATRLSPPNWANYTNVVGSGIPQLITAPLLPVGSQEQYFRVNRR